MCGLIRASIYLRNKRCFEGWIAGSSPAMTKSAVRVASPAPPVARILHQIAVVALFADVLFFVVAVALGGVDGDLRLAAGALVALVVFGNGRDGFGHARSPVLARRDNAGRSGRVPGSPRRSSTLNFIEPYPRPQNLHYPDRVLSNEGRFMRRSEVGQSESWPEGQPDG